MNVSLQIVVSLYIGTQTSIWILAFVPIVIIICYFLSAYYIRALREITRIESTSNSPMITLLSETLLGATTIRAYGKVDDYVTKN